MKRTVWTISVFSVAVMAIVAGVVLYLSTDSPELPNVDSASLSGIQPVPSSSPVAGPVEMAVSHRSIETALPVWHLDMDDPRYVLVGHTVPKGVVIQVRASLVNVTDSGLSLDELRDFTLIDDDGEEHSMSAPAAVRPGWVRFRRTPIPELHLHPWESYNASLYFDLPETVAYGELQLRFRDGPGVPFRILSDG